MQTSVQVTLPVSLSNIPSITASKQSFITSDWRVTAVTKSGFILELQSPKIEPVVFDWHAFEGR